MIRIDTIYPLAGKIKSMSINDLEPLFLAQIKKYTNPYSLLDTFKTTSVHSFSPTNSFSIADPTHLAIVTYLYDNFDTLIIGKPSALEAIIAHFRTQNWHTEIYDTVNERSTNLGLALLDIFGYKEKFRGIKSKGIWLAQQLNIKSCPYCNAQYTLYVSDNSSKELLKFQYDHFFPKSIYPYLSISLYNLIPSCANCNIKKSNKAVNLKEYYHPYNSDLSKFAKFKLKYVPDPKLLTINSVRHQKFEVEFVHNYKDPDNIVGRHNKLFQINGIYSRHEDVFQELLIKAIIYSRSLIKSHLKIERLFPDKELYLRYLIGNYPYRKDILNRPLAKFTQDVAKQLKLIK